MEFRGSPLFGIGQGKLPELIGLVAHNSYIEAYTELGVVGGTCFVAAVTYPIWALWRLRRRLDPRRQPTLSRLRAYLLAAIVVHAVGMLSLSRVYTQTTYLMVGMGTVFLARAAEVVPGAMPPLSPRLAIRVTLVSGAFLIALQIVTTVLIRRS